MSPEEPNGMLPLVLGQFVAQGARSLPPAGPYSSTEMHSLVDTGESQGLVRIRYRLMRHKRGKQVYWFWTAVHAETAADASERPKENPAEPG